MPTIRDPSYGYIAWLCVQRFYVRNHLSRALNHNSLNTVREYASSLNTTSILLDRRTEPFNVSFLFD